MFRNSSSWGSPQDAFLLPLLTLFLYPIRVQLFTTNHVLCHCVNRQEKLKVTWAFGLLRPLS